MDLVTNKQDLREVSEDDLEASISNITCSDNSFVMLLNTSEQEVLECIHIDGCYTVRYINDKNRFIKSTILPLSKNTDLTKLFVSFFNKSSCWDEGADFRVEKYPGLMGLVDRLLTKWK